MSAEQELYGLLVPLLDERLLVPRACVAEVTSFQPLQEMPGAPPWYLGIQAWNGRGVPVVSFEGACGKRIPVIGGRTRIVIFTCLGQKLPAGPLRHRHPGFPPARAREPAGDRAGQLARVPGSLARALPGAHGQRAAADPRPRAPRGNDRRRDDRHRRLKSVS